MAKLCLMASRIYSLGFSHQEQRFCRDPKAFQPFIPGPGTKPKIIQSVTFHLGASQFEDPWKSMSLLLESNHSIKHGPLIRGPILVNVQEDVRLDSVLFSTRIAEQCKRHTNILQFLMSKSNEVDRDGMNFSMLSDLMELETFGVNMIPQPISPSDNRFWHYDVGVEEPLPFYIRPGMEVYAQKPLLDFLGDMTRNSKITINPRGQVLFSGSRAEVNDLLSIVAELSLPKCSTKYGRRSLLVPHFTSKPKANINGSLKLETMVVRPLKSPVKIKLKPPRKKHGKKTGKERDLYKKNYFHASESLLSLIMEKKHGKRTTILSLRKYGPELTQILNNCAVGIAGTGIAILFSVLCKVSGGRVPFCASKLLNTGLGLGLVWLSSTVNKLGNSILYFSKNSRKSGVNDEEMMIKRVDNCVNEIFFKASTLVAIAALRFA